MTNDKRTSSTYKGHLILLGSILLVSITIQHALAYTEEENFAYINGIIEKLNNNEECQLPSYEEVNEMFRSFRELEINLGRNLVLNQDQRLVRNTVLDQWVSFRKRMTDAVVIRSAKTRAFLGKIEKYQNAKFGSSICTQLGKRRIIVTDKIFEKNPIVRYLKHLETKEVIERPENEPETQTQVPTVAQETTTTGSLEKDSKAEVREETITVPPGTRLNELHVYFGRDPNEKPSTESPAAANENTPAAIDSDELIDSSGVVHKQIGEYVEQDATKKPEAAGADHDAAHDEISIEEEGPEFDEDPLSEIPEPIGSEESDGADAEEIMESSARETNDDQKSDDGKQEAEEEEEEEEQEGVEYIDRELNDRILAQLVRVRRHIDSDPVINSFEWPDESRITRKEQKIVKENYDELRAVWTEFLKDPFPEPEVVEEEPTTLPPINPTTIAQKKKEFLEQNALKNRMSDFVGWNDDSYPQARYIETEKDKKRKDNERRKRIKIDKKNKKYQDKHSNQWQTNNQPSNPWQVNNQPSNPWQVNSQPSNPWQINQPSPQPMQPMQPVQPVQPVQQVQPAQPEHQSHQTFQSHLAHLAQTGKKLFHFGEGVASEVLPVAAEFAQYQSPALAHGIQGVATALANHNNPQGQQQNMFQPQNQQQFFQQPSMFSQQPVMQNQPSNMFQQASNMFQQGSNMFQQPSNGFNQQQSHNMFQQAPMQQATSMFQQQQQQQPTNMFQQQPTNMFQQPNQMQQSSFAFQQPSNMFQQQSHIQQPSNQPSLFQQGQQAFSSWQNPSHVSLPMPNKNKKDKKNKKKDDFYKNEYNDNRDYSQKWTTIADNKMCKIDYNMSYVPKYMKTASNWVKSRTAQAAKKVLIAVDSDVYDDDEEYLSKIVKQQFPG